jgi:S-adenosylmethionine synthetase
MFGFACNETPELMPLPISVAHALAQRLAQVRHQGLVEFLRPDGKTQATIGYENGVPTKVATLVVSTQHNPGISHSEITNAVTEFVIEPVLERFKFDIRDTQILVNPTSQFIVGGPQADAGLTGRKIIVDTYGGYSRHGGGAFSGKDPSKVDRSAAYATRWVAKNVVAAGLADKVEIQVSYAIGRARPLAIYVETFGTAKLDPKAIERAIADVFDLRPAAIIQELDLLRPIYGKTSTYGHFGRELPEFSWEKLNKVDDLRSAVGF